MDAEFVNNYTEVLKENFDAIIKQNLILQTQLKSLSKKNESAELVQKDNLKVKEELSKEIETYKKQLLDLKNTISQFENVVKEKDRIQHALNETMKNIVILNNEIKQKDDEIVNLKKENAKLEKNPSSLVKTKTKELSKTKNGKSANIETPPKSVKVQSGGFF